jgi:hypothetical protein
MDPAFRRGSRSFRTYEKLRDPMAAAWHERHRKPWHAVELHWRSIRDKAVDVPALGAGHDVHVEVGQAVGRKGTPLEADDERRFNHFGIADMSSNPVYTRQDYDALVARTAPRSGTDWQWDPRAKLSTILVPDPLANHPDCFGSYFVFRKFSEDVPKFLAKLKAIAQKLLDSRGNGWWWKQYPALLDLKDEDLNALKERIDAKVPAHEALSNKAGIVLCQLIFGVGPDGQRPTGATDNNFNYGSDTEGKRCPFSAHARATNARGSRLAAQLERKTLIARRGISTQGGLLFWCAQASIGEQFEYIQEKWANASNVNLDHQASPGVDYLIGRTAEPEPGFNLDVREALTLRASEYLFAPSLVGFRRLRAIGGAR